MAAEHVTFPKTMRLVDKVAKRRDMAAHWQHVCHEVEVRDRFRCRACGRKVVQTLSVQINRLEHHHVIPRSLGGLDETWNVCLLDLFCHSLRHVTRELTITGNADERLTFERNGATWEG